ncbi:MAG: queuosine 5'-phosphate N-glycosylase/hydrolase [Ktedonobacterales bacterium]
MGTSSEYQNRREHAGEFELLRPDRLGVLTATAAVMRTSRYLTLDQAATRALAERWEVEPWPETTGFDSLHWSDGTERTVNFVLVLDALNFCFWGEPGQARWRISFRGQVLDGYNALAASLSRAVHDGCPIWDAGYLAAMRGEELAQILRPIAESPEIPLFEERLANVREVGRVLLGRYNGQFATAVDSAGGSAVALVSLVVRDFPSFRDVTWRQNSMVPFFKRAQICVADLHAAFGGKGYGTFVDLDELTAFADYKLPQLLRRYGLLIYSTGLAGQVDQLQPLKAGGEEEIEIRSATIWGVEWLRRELARHGMRYPASAIDYRLWSDSQTMTSDTRPYHRTRTIYY